MAITGEDLFWELVEPMYADPAVQRSTMMGLPCVRLHGRFFASLDRRTGALLVKLPADRVGQLVVAGDGEPFAPPAGCSASGWHCPGRTGDGGARCSPRPATTPTAPASRTRRAPTRSRDSVPPGWRSWPRWNATTPNAVSTPTVRSTGVSCWSPRKRSSAPWVRCSSSGCAAGLRAEPRVGGSLFRIANDLRFARDQPPYKPHLDFAFWQGHTGPRHDPALILRIAPTEILVGCGVMPRTGTALAAYRTALGDPASVADLDRHVSTLLADGAELSEPTRRRPPAGFDPAGPDARFAVRDGWHLVRRYACPAEVTTAALVDWCADRLAPFAPVHHWLTQAPTTGLRS